MDDIPSYIFLIVLALVLIILSMLFSISESAFLGLNKLRLRIRRQKKERTALRVGKLLDKKEKLINTLLVSNELVNIFLSAILTSISLALFGEKGVGIATLAATILLLIFGEITPKTIATRCPDKIAYGLSFFVRIVYIIMTPVVFVCTFLSRSVLRIFGIKTNEKTKSYSAEDIKTFFDISSESGVIEENENRMMSQIFKFSDLEAQDIMVPRTKIRAISVDSTYRDIIELSQRLGFTRFPVYKDSIDDIVGILYLKDLMKYKNDAESFELKKIMRPPIFVLGTKKMSSVQEILFENRQSMVIVVDEYSGTDGIVTEKDISREIFALPGDDSLRGKVFDFESVEDKSDFEINGSVLLRTLKENLHIQLESEINETIGGWFIEKLNRMPEVEDKIEFQGWEFIVKKVQAHRIERIRIKALKKQDEDDD
ncbi:MAG: hemolysin family protein [Treponema sp.]|nr:hemolysin family protein [Treponema sp.]